MSKKAILLALFASTCLLLVTGCTPTCDAASLEAPELVSPDWREVIDGGAALLEWSYPDASCQPDEFEIILSQDRDFSSIEVTQLVPGDTTSWTPPALDDAEEYFWRVRAKVGSTYGPYSFERRSFFTGPTCDAADLVMPSLVSPPGGGIFDRASDSLEWEWPISSCIPESYRVEVSQDPDFADTTYNGGTGSPGTRWGFGTTPPPATQFWWRISAYADGVYGPASIASRFFTDPVCSGSSLVRPVALTPLDDEVVPVGNPEFSWSYPDTSCVPEGYHLLISTMPDLSTMALEADDPTIFGTDFQAGVALPDCAEYYWQVSVYAGGVESLPSYTDRFVVDSGSCGCSSGSIVIPDLEAPGPYEILPDTAAQLRWSNPGGCFPDGSAVQIATEYDFGDAVESTFPGPFVNGYDPPALDPATQYRWKAAYTIDDGSGPEIGEYSSQRSFFTGPECVSLTEVSAPERLAPEDGAEVDTLTPALQFRPGMPGCIPDGYYLNLQDNPSFSGTNLLGEFSLPATTVLPDPPLTDCTMYYWKVAAIQDASYGPLSDTGSFYVNESGTCPPPAIPSIARSNNFCRSGTFPAYFEALWTFEVDDPALAIARNPFSTYLRLMVVDKVTGLPLEPIITCWSMWDAFDPLEGYDFRDLPAEEPPPTPVPTLTPTPMIDCHEKLSESDCALAGGEYDGKLCICP